jgi:hypothetical protein bfra3_11936
MINNVKIHAIVLIMILSFFLPCSAQQVIKAPSYKAHINETGQLDSYILMPVDKRDTVSFRTGKYAGFAFEGINLKQIHRSSSSVSFQAVKDSICYQLSYQDHNDCLCIIASVENLSSKIFMPKDGVKLFCGINTYMEKYPQWNNIYFPTMMRSERSHFTSYFMTPQKKILVLASPDPIASWCHEYEGIKGELQGKQVMYGGHRIYTSSLYLLHTLPLPLRHPQDLYCLKPKEKKTIRLYLKPISTLDKVPETFFHLTQAPSLSAELYTLPLGEEFEGSIFANKIQRITIQTPRSEVDTLSIRAVTPFLYKWKYKPYSGIGIYTVTVVDLGGKISEMKLYVRPDFDFYLRNARKEALRSKPTTTHHAECFYPLYTYLLSKKYVPDVLEDQKTEIVFDSIFAVLYDEKVGEMRNGKYRIQDAATMAGILSDRFQITKNENDLNKAASLVDYLIKCQYPDGGYYDPVHKVHYTSVIYIAKSIMEVMNEEKKLATISEKWKNIYEKHKISVKKAIDDLAIRGDNLETEGQMTFEDGMISCSIAQLALAALKTENSEECERYTNQAIELNNKHLCLTQSLIPDARMNGATMRFWEYQYAVNLMHNGLNSPCGWSAWKYYGSWYLYLLTGNYQYLKEVINGLGSCMQLLDYNTKELRFSFIPDPYIEGYQFMEVPIGSKEPRLNKVILGEQYVPQISSWHFTTPYAWRKTKFGIDNFVHEIYKCMCEIFVENAYIIEIQPGVLKGINCHLKKENGYIKVSYANSHVKNLHINIQTDYILEINNKIYQEHGLKWLIGYPNDLLKY